MKSSWKLIGLLAAAMVALGGCNKPAAENTPREEAHDAHADEQAGGRDAHGDEHGEAHGEHEEGKARLTADAQRKIGLRTIEARVQRVESMLATMGELAVNADREAHVNSQVPGRVIRIPKTLGDPVRAGEVLAVLESPELGAAQATFLEAQARYELAHATFKRQEKLLEDELTAAKEVLAAENQLTLARIEREKAENQLKLFGYTEGRIRKLAAQRKLDPTVPITAPLAGVVTDRHLTLGEVIDSKETEPAFTLLDTSELWAYANLYERDLTKVKLGQSAVVTIAALPGKSFTGRVTFISPDLDPETRTARARVVVANPGGILKPRMFANIRIAVGSQQSLAIPASAVQQDKQETFVFVQTGPETFEQRKVEVGPKAGALVPVLAGILPGDKVVSEGSFTLKSEALKESFGEHHH